MIQHDRRPRAARASRPFLFAPLAALSLAAGCGSHTFGDTDDTNPDSSSPTNVIKVDDEARVDLPGRVSALIRVTNADGTPAAGLVGSDFDIYEGGTLVSATESFQQIRPQPQRFRNYLHLILDRSNSVQSSANAAFLQEGATAFLDLVLPSSDQQGSTYVKVSWFDGQPDLHPIPGHDLGFTNDRSALDAAIADLNDEPPLNGSTNLYGAVSQGLDDLEEVEALNVNVPNRALGLVTFTDGTHQAGGSVTLQGLVDKINAGTTNGTPYSAFTIGVGSEIDPLVLAALGPDGSASRDEFGILGQAFAEVGESVADYANSYYDLSYCSPKSSDRWDLDIGVRGSSETVRFEFWATNFGAGCAFFDHLGHEELASPGESMRVTDAVELATGEVVLCGWRSATCTAPGCGTRSRAFVARLEASPHDAEPEDVVDGRLDTNFGTDGYLYLEDALTGFEVSGATSLVVEPTTGTLLVGGWSRASAQSGFSEATLWSVTADGSSATRTLIATEGSADEAVTDLVRTSTGALLAGGFRGAAGARSSAVWRLFDSLALDTGFGTAGRVLIPATPSPTVAGVARLVLAGGDRVYAIGEADQRIRIHALDTLDGGLDTAFAGDGAVDAVSVFNGLDHVCTPMGATLDGSGRLLVSGSYVDAQTGTARRRPAIWRVLDTGTPDLDFHGSPSSPTANTGIATLRTGSTNDEARDFGRDTFLSDVTVGPDGTILATGWRDNAEGHTDMAVLAFKNDGRSEGSYNIVGFAIHDGASADDSFDEATVVRVLDSGAIWAIGVSNPDAGAPSSSQSGDIPTVWVDRDPARVFAPLGN